MMHNHLEIPLDSIGPDGRNLDFRIEAADLLRELKERDAHDILPTGPVSVILKLTNEADEVALTGRVTGNVERECVKCLDRFPQKLDAEFSLKLKRGGARSGMDGHPELELKASDLDIETFDGEYVDLAAVVYEQIILSLPDYPQCGPDCKGICPECGAELNRGPCGCGAEKPVDPRLAALLKLKRPAG